MRDLRLTLLQSPLHWQDTGANLAMFEEKLAGLDGPQDIILLPEMFSTGFSMAAAKLAEPMNLTTFRWMKLQAGRLQSVVAGSYIVRENGHFYNRFIWMRPDGSWDQYDKRHLFRMAEEQKVYTPGNDRLIVELEGWKICPMVCYDLRFPVWSRNRFLEEENCLEYDLLLYVANWPAPRHQAWDNLLRARAIENLCYCAGVNRIGTDGNEVSYQGGSMAIDMKGSVLADLGEKEDARQVILSAGELSAYRKKFPAHLDADRFEIKN